MTAQEFCYWLQGYFEIGGTKEISAEQAKIIQDHLQLVFTKVTPERVTTAVSTVPFDPNWQTFTCQPSPANATTPIC